MKRLLISILVCATLFGVCTYRHNVKAEWYNTRKTIIFVVNEGDTMRDIAAKYRPSWMTINEYMNDIKQLNDMTTYNLCVGDRLKVYVMGGAY